MKNDYSQECGKHYYVHVTIDRMCGVELCCIEWKMCHMKQS